MNTGKLKRQPEGERCRPDRLAGAARECIARHAHFRGREELFHVTEQNGSLIVEGVVPSFFLKQVLQTLLQRLEGVRSVDNRVTVRSPEGLECSGSKLERHSHGRLAANQLPYARRVGGQEDLPAQASGGIASPAN
jgi:osmotically-inducible protein OsmY